MNEQLRTNAEEDIPQARDMGKPESLENSVADTLPYDEELELEERWLGFGGLASTLAGGIDCLAGVIRHGARNIASELDHILHAGARGGGWGRRARHGTIRPNPRNVCGGTMLPSRSAPPPSSCQP